MWARNYPFFIAFIAACLITSYPSLSRGQESGYISGTVLRADGNIPLAGVTVHAGSIDTVAEVTTDPDGRYLLSDLNPGSYLVRTTADGYGESTRTSVSVAAARITAGIDFTLIPSGAINGHVVASTDQTPLTAIAVRAMNTEHPRVWQTISDETGSFSFEGLFPGSYTVWAEDASFAPFYILDQRLNKGQTIDDLRIELSTGGTISGSATHADGTTPVSDAVVSVYDPDNPLNSLKAETNSAGDYTISLVPPGSYTVICNTAADSVLRSDPVSLAHGEVISGVDFIFAGNTAAITGRVTQADLTTPVQGATVVAFSLVTPLGFETDETDSEGRYTLSGLPASDDYTLKVDKDGFAAFLQEGITIQEDQTIELDPVLLLE